MGAAEQIPRISFEEFLRLEELNASKHEWLDGIVYMMAGGTFEHGRLVDNLLVTLRGDPGRCDRSGERPGGVGVSAIRGGSAVGCSSTIHGPPRAA